jgi:hypothetical protein
MHTHPKINIIFRTCDKINAVHGSPRPFNLSKIELIKICFISLLEALQGFNYQICVVADDISVQLLQFFNRYDVKIIQGVFGNDNSLKECFAIASQLPNNEYVYFCEDDYLHQENTFHLINEVIESFNTFKIGDIKFKQLLRKRELLLLNICRYFKRPDFLIFPTDYPDRYTKFYVEKSFVFQSKSTHWRQIRDITFTFFISTNTFKVYHKIFFKSSKRANDRYLSRKILGKSWFFDKLIGLSPMPSQTCHMHTETMSGVVNWHEIVKKIREKHHL